MGYNPPPPPPALTSVPNPYEMYSNQPKEHFSWLTRIFGLKGKTKNETDLTNAEILQAAYEQVTEIGIPAGLEWRMSFRTMMTLRWELDFGDTDGKTFSYLADVYVALDDDMPHMMVYLEGDCVQMTCKMTHRHPGVRIGWK